jgi:hypothetical protein
MERTQLLVYIAVTTLIIVIFIACLLVRRHGRTAETAKLLKHMESLRAQNSAEHGQQEGFLRATRSDTSWLRHQWEKFRSWPEPPKPEDPK